MLAHRGGCHRSDLPGERLRRECARAETEEDTVSVTDRKPGLANFSMMAFFCF